MTSAKVTRNNALKTQSKPKAGNSKPQRTLRDINSDRGLNKVPYEAENIEHTIRRTMREKEKQRAKNPGLYL